MKDETEKISMTAKFLSQKTGPEKVEQEYRVEAAPPDGTLGCL
jgi:hypothetical protein